MKPLVAVVGLLAAGCAAEPFSRPPLPVLKNPNPQTVRENFASRLPDSTRAGHKSNLHFPFMDMTLLERVDVDRPKDLFTLQGYVPLGVMIYDLSGNRDSITINSAHSQWDKYRFVLESIGHDLRDTYLDLTPGPNAKAIVWSKEVFFSQKNHDGTLSFEFAYDPPVLIEKRLSGLFGTIWRIRYYDYRTGPDGKIRPGGVVIDDNRSIYHFRIVLHADDLHQPQTDQLQELLAAVDLFEQKDTP